MLANLRSLQGGTATSDVGSGASMATRATNIEADAAESPAVSTEVDGHHVMIGSWRQAQSALFTQTKSMAEKVVIRQVDLDNPLPTKDITSALTELIRQMEGASADIADSTVSAGSQTNLSSPVGTATIVCSILDARGYILQTPFAETLRFTVIADAQSGSATARNESVRVTGKASIPDVSAYNWPGGSGVNKTLSIVDAQSDNARGNLLYNGDFETFLSTNTPQDWVIGVGAAGTNVFAAGSGYTGSNALKITGDAGGTITTVRQTFDTPHTTAIGTGGTPAELKPKTQYAVGMWIRRDNSLSAGVLTVSLVDGSNSVTADVSGTNNSFTVDCTSLTGSYVFYSGTFRTPATLPTDGFKLQLATTTAIDDGDSIFIDDIFFTEMTQLYNGGPFVCIAAGDTNVVLNDRWTLAISCTMGGFASWMERFFSLRDKGLQFPYDSGGSETVADSLIA